MNGHLWDVDVRGPDDCWEWLAPLNNQGYGYFWDRKDQRVVLAHRRAWERVNGPIPAGLIIRHSCDNRACCNPAHLSTGTARDNAQDCKDHGRAAAWYRPRNGGASHPMARLTPDDIAAIKDMRESGATYAAIGQRFGISFQHAQKVCAGRTWAGGRTGRDLAVTA